MRRLIILVTCIAISVLLSPTVGRAATFEVNSTNDAVDANPYGDNTCATSSGECTLRAAVMQANARPGRDIIIIPEGEYVFTIDASEGDFDASQGDLDIFESVDIRGAGASKTIINPDNKDRAFVIVRGDGKPPVEVSIEGITISDGEAKDGNGGGAILNVDGNLSLRNSTIRHNSTAGGSGGGGGINSEGGSLSIVDSTIMENHTEKDNGGGVRVKNAEAPLLIMGSTISNNNAASFGGGIYANSVEMTIENSTISANCAEEGGGGLAFSGGTSFLRCVTVYGNGVEGEDANGGGIFVSSSGELSLSNSVVARNYTLHGNYPDCVVQGEGSSLKLIGGNLIYSLEGCDNLTGDKGSIIQQEDPKLEYSEPESNGGPTAVYYPKEGSPVIDAGETENSPQTDQRGYRRPWDGDGDGQARPDLGAVEVTNCGDRVTDDGEECDDGNDDNTDACLNTCVSATCGDGFVQKGVEGCDDGNDDNTDACLNTCVSATCGDGVVQSDVEACDDGELNSDTEPDACRSNCTVAYCGDGVADDGEECDDGNLEDGDGCSSKCLIEKGTSTEEPTPTDSDTTDGGAGQTKACLPSPAEGDAVWLRVPAFSRIW